MLKKTSFVSAAFVLAAVFALAAQAPPPAPMAIKQV